MTWRTAPDSADRSLPRRQGGTAARRQGSEAARQRGGNAARRQGSEAARQRGGGRESRTAAARLSWMPPASPPVSGPPGHTGTAALHVRGGPVPTYAYACTACDHRFEAVQAFTDDTLTVCPECEGRLRKVFN
ncbi:MAG: FmdB family zinc ribbon protein, partial [Phycicoccus sp.]